MFLKNYIRLDTVIIAAHVSYLSVLLCSVYNSQIRQYCHMQDQTVLYSLIMPANVSFNISKEKSWWQI
jgi:hypothetical protein